MTEYNRIQSNTMEYNGIAYYNTMNTKENDGMPSIHKNTQEELGRYPATL